MRWLEDVEGIYMATNAVDREEWATVVKETKAVRGPYSQAVSKYVSFRIIHNIPVPASPS
jgi:hypothetical protein